MGNFLGLSDQEQRIEHQNARVDVATMSFRVTRKLRRLNASIEHTENAKKRAHARQDRSAFDILCRKHASLAREIALYEKIDGSQRATVAAVDGHISQATLREYIRTAPGLEQLTEFNADAEREKSRQLQALVDSNEALGEIKTDIEDGIADADTEALDASAANKEWDKLTQLNLDERLQRLKSRRVAVSGT